jgi:hypothetical protein
MVKEPSSHDAEVLVRLTRSRIAGAIGLVEFFEANGVSALPFQRKGPTPRSNVDFSFRRFEHLDGLRHHELVAPVADSRMIHGRIVSNPQADHEYEPDLFRDDRALTVQILWNSISNHRSSSAGLGSHGWPRDTVIRRLGPRPPSWHTLSVRAKSGTARCVCVRVSDGPAGSHSTAMSNIDCNGALVSARSRREVLMRRSSVKSAHEVIRVFRSKCACERVGLDRVAEKFAHSPRENLFVPLGERYEHCRRRRFFITLDHRPHDKVELSFRNLRYALTRTWTEREVRTDPAWVSPTVISSTNRESKCIRLGHYDSFTGSSTQSGSENPDVSAASCRGRSQATFTDEVP